MSDPQSVYIRSYGCQMNVYDSSRMTDVMVDAGYEVARTPHEANLIVLNTCHIREKATEKVYSEVGRFKTLKTGDRDVIIAVAGCVAQAEGEEIIRRQPLISLVVGPQSYHRLPEHVARARMGERIVDVDFPADEKFASLPLPDRRPGRFSAYLTIQEGCDKFCTFCVVPYTRGHEYSRAPSQIRAEAERLVASGVCELTLLGQNVNAYHFQDTDGQVWTLARLLHWLAEIPGLARLRFTTSHPRDMSEDLTRAFADCAKLMPYLHLPIQSGSDRILKRMNRRHTAAEYLETIDRVRQSRPDTLISGDFIVGFPGETDTDFRATLDVVREVGY
ncbi:MAG: tRNA (N6-isopentenyl adenosine(37)-C2)-methylthiotransferase MiaB, partial [Rhodobacteraceae bacterium]|nr:tRNA (N6-isopentenyl adenosine(37)-C2)-methylthiotransferase MiaB [Paracoccaceae bacterium]